MTLAPWLAGPWRVLAEALSAGRLHHGLLVAAPPGSGKRALVDAFATAALCMQPNPDRSACGRCRSCQLVAAGSHPDLARVTFELRDDGKPRSEIIVDQIRVLSQRLAMSSQFGGLQLAVIDPADRLNASAANALLKTLEEPTPATVLVLVADEPARLPATIRSRCQRVDVRLPARDEALQWLQAQGIEARQAGEALDASLGNPGLALAWLEDGSLALRKASVDDLDALARGRTAANTIAERWAGDQPERRLWFAAAHARDEAGRLASHRASSGLTASNEIPKLAAWFTQANRARGLLATPLRTELVLLDLLRAWPVRAAGSAGRG